MTKNYIRLDFSQLNSVHIQTEIVPLIAFGQAPLLLIGRRYLDEFLKIQFDLSYTQP